MLLENNQRQGGTGNSYHTIPVRNLLHPSLVFKIIRTFMAD